MDLVHTRIAAEFLSPTNLGFASDENSIQTAISRAVAMLYEAKNPVVIVDALTARHQGQDIARKLVDKLQWPTFSTSMGKSIINETKSYFSGIYNGKVSIPGVCDAVEQQSDLVLDIGPILSDSNTGGHTRNIDVRKMIAIHPHQVIVAGTMYRNVGIVSCRYNSRIGKQSLIRRSFIHSTGHDRCV